MLLDVCAEGEPVESVWGRSARTLVVSLQWFVRLLKRLLVLRCAAYSCDLAERNQL